jgi:acyl dehydratase
MTEHSMTVGTEFAGHPRRITEARLLTFSGGPLTNPDFPRKNIHTNLEFAQSTGVPTRIASGTQYQGHLFTLLIDLFGETWLSEGTMAVKMTDIVREGDTVTAKAKVTAAEPSADGTLVTMDVWSERQDGATVLAGTATGIAR